jgi:hypothetical protein
MRDCLKPSPDLAMIAEPIGDNQRYKRKGEAEEKKTSHRVMGGKDHGAGYFRGLRPGHF